MRQIGETTYMMKSKELMEEAVRWIARLETPERSGAIAALQSISEDMKVLVKHIAAYREGQTFPMMVDVVTARGKMVSVGVDSPSDLANFFKGIGVED